MFLKVLDLWLSDVDEIKDEVKTYFSKQVKEEGFSRPTLDDINFRSLNPDESYFFTSPFSMEEVEVAVWSCEGSKSPGPDGFNFTFIKPCLEVLKEEIHVQENKFHNNAKLPTAFTSSFVAMIRKVKNPIV